MHKLVVDNLLSKGLLEKKPFLITNQLIQSFMDEYIALTGTKGNTGKNTNTLYSRKLAALSFIKFKQEHKLPITEGFVYCISNPAWVNQYKIGMSQNPKERLAQYQTYSPYRDYKLEHWSFWFDKRKGEKLIHQFFKDLKEHEWFNIDSKKLHKYLETINSSSDLYGSLALIG
ncbi:GIY-YIG nuclease family protein [Salmonella enterica]|nr:GIY-YIG nuclease family protein [Salmonella enterica]